MKEIYCKIISMIFYNSAAEESKGFQSLKQIKTLALRFYWGQ